MTQITINLLMYHSEQFANRFDQIIQRSKLWLQIRAKFQPIKYPRTIYINFRNSMILFLSITFKARKIPF